MTDNTISRVHYFERQFLRTQDFSDEQAYHIAMRRRHNISHHTWGIVSGLQLVVEDGIFFVQPGVAVDGYGRELVLPQKQPLSAKAFIDKASTELDVWLIYGLLNTDKPPAGYAGCGNGNAKDGNAFYRSQETARVILEKPNPDFPDRRQPQGVVIADRNFSPSRTPPDIPDAYWPVFLGTIVNDPAIQQQPYAVKLDDRPYVGLVGESINAPSGRARVQVGSELANDTRRFAVFTLDEANPNSPLQSRLDIDTQGELRVRGDASMYGNLTMAGGAIEFEAGTARGAGLPPWNVYHLSEERVVSGVNARVEELRVEMAGPAAAVAGNNQVVIGAWFKGPDNTGQEKETFHPCLTISDDCSVEVCGNLIVRGQINPLGGETAGQLTASARSAITGAFLSGVAGSAGAAGAVASAGAPVLARISSPVLNAGVFAAAVAADPALLASFADSLRTDHPHAADSLRTALTIIVP